MGSCPSTASRMKSESSTSPTRRRRPSGGRHSEDGRVTAVTESPLSTPSATNRRPHPPEAPNTMIRMPWNLDQPERRRGTRQPAGGRISPGTGGPAPGIRPSANRPVRSWQFRRNWQGHRMRDERETSRIGSSTYKAKLPGTKCRSVGRYGDVKPRRRSWRRQSPVTPCAVGPCLASYALDQFWQFATWPHPRATTVKCWVSPLIRLRHRAGVF